MLAHVSTHSYSYTHTHTQFEILTSWKSPSAEAYSLQLPLLLQKISLSEKEGKQIFFNKASHNKKWLTLKHNSVCMAGRPPQVQKLTRALSRSSIRETLNYPTPKHAEMTKWPWPKKKVSVTETPYRSRTKNKTSQSLSTISCSKNTQITWWHSTNTWKAVSAKRLTISSHLAELGSRVFFFFFLLPGLSLVVSTADSVMSSETTSCTCSHSDTFKIPDQQSKTKSYSIHNYIKKTEAACLSSNWTSCKGMSGIVA